MHKLKFIFAALVLAALAGGVRAQRTTVSGTFHDPNGFTYGGGTLTAQLVTTGGALPSINGQPIQTSIGPTTLNPDGSMPASGFPDTSLIVPAGSQWSITVCSLPNLPSPGLGPQCGTIKINVTGASQDISAAMNAVLPSISQVPAGGGNISGTCANTQILFGTGVHSIACSPNFTYTAAAGETVTASADADTALIVLPNSATQWQPLILAGPAYSSLSAQAQGNAFDPAIFCGPGFTVGCTVNLFTSNAGAFAWQAVTDVPNATIANGQADAGTALATMSVTLGQDLTSLAHATAFVIAATNVFNLNGHDAGPTLSNISAFNASTFVIGPGHIVLDTTFFAATHDTSGSPTIDIMSGFYAGHDGITPGAGTITAAFYNEDFSTDYSFYSLGGKVHLGNLTASLPVCTDTGQNLVSTGCPNGTVTSVSSGNFTPLFNVGVGTPTTTPAISFTAINQNANLIFAGPSSGGAAAPTFRSLVSADIPAGIKPSGYVTCTQATPCASTATTVITSAAADSQYAINASIDCTSAVATATALLVIKYTDPSNTVQTITPSAATCTTLGPSSVIQINQIARVKASTAMQYSVTIANAPLYQASVAFILEGN